MADEFLKLAPEGKKDATASIYPEDEEKPQITAFSAEQLKDLGYVSKLWKAICDNSDSLA